MKCKQCIVSSCDPCALCPNWRSLPMILLTTAAPLMVRCCCCFVSRFLCLYLYWCCSVVLYVWILLSPMFLWKHAMSVNIRVMLQLHKITLCSTCSNFYLFFSSYICMPVFSMLLLSQIIISWNEILMDVWHEISPLSHRLTTVSSESEQVLM